MCPGENGLLGGEVTDWLQEAREAFRPPERMLVSDWSDRYRILDAKTSSRSGPWRTATTPYLKGVMDAFVDPEIEEIWFCKPTQVGGTEGINNIIGYCITQDPSATMVVYPTDKLAKHVSTNRIQPMLELCPRLSAEYLPDESQDLELQFRQMTLVFSGANSPSSLASHPIRYLFLDEVDKYPATAGKEAGPIDLARERTNSYNTSRKIVAASTPTYKLGNVWRAVTDANQLLRYFVTCPHCGVCQDLRFSQLKWPKGAEPEDARLLAWYECDSCHERINDADKASMLRTGHWEVVEQRGRGKRMVAFHLNALYSPWIRFGDVAAKWLYAQGDKPALQNFINSWLAEPWEDKSVELSSDVVISRQSEYEEGVVPDGAMILTAGVDKQADHMYWTVRAWGPGLTSWNIAHGTALDWTEIEQIMNRPWRRKNGEELLVSLCGVDSGNQTDEVYEFCTLNQEWAIPVKGASRPMVMRFRISTIDKVGSRAQGQRLITLDTAQYKNMIASRMRRPNGKGSWMVFKGCDRDYAEQVTAEQKTTVVKNGVEVERWEKKSTHGDNHYFDAEVYAACAADLMQVRYLAESEPEPEETPANASSGVPQPAGGGWINQKGNWI